LGDRYLLSTTQQASDIAALIAIYHAALRDAACPVQKPLLNRIVCTVANKEHKAQALAFFGDIFLATYGHWGHDNVADLDLNDRDYDKLNRELFIIGEPSECIERIHAYEDLGIGHIACLMNFGGADPEMADRSLRLFGEKVLPMFA
jgi:alkanesulfonate monooxygenase SsuD/methylene tetrahydromethanopterin reductase-like flavin-dependent oxidoreductase (luciferase family)